MITEQKLSVAEVARRLDVSETLLRAWRKAVLAGGRRGLPRSRPPGPGRRRGASLARGERAPRAERDLLKKAAAYFANPPA